MKTGRRVADPNKKALMGTYRDDRHGNIVELVTPAKSVPIPPAYLTREARLVWDEELPRVCQTGITEVDSSAFARYCTMESIYRGQVVAGELPPAAYLVELRRMAELLGIAGLRSRLAKLGNDKPATASPFTPRTS